MKHWHLILSILLLSALIITFFLSYGLYRFTQQPLAIPENGLLYELYPGTSVISLANNMTKAGYIDHPHYLRILAEYHGVTKSLKAGKYEIPYGTTPTDLLVIFTRGNAIIHSLTIIEGWNIYQLLAAINTHNGLVHTLNGLSPGIIMEKLGHPGEHPEGRFYPDTYHFPGGTTDVAFLKRAYQHLKSVLKKQWAMRDKNQSLQSPYEALILASIVEKETAKAGERPLIAGVFIRRLANGMRLQTDPTVIYGIGNSFNGNISRRDLTTNTPYNTYLHAGLPPTPICMPGETAINAALHPSDGKALYFVARGDGSHYFSPTLEEHNIAVRRFQIKKR